MSASLPVRYVPPLFEVPFALVANLPTRSVVNFTKGALAFADALSAAHDDRVVGLGRLRPAEALGSVSTRHLRLTSSV